MSSESQVAGKPLVDVNDRAFAFAVRVVKLCQYLEKGSDVSRSLINQLMRAASSVGANLEEAIAGQSRPDFIHKSAIALKEAREANYWLRLIQETSTFDAEIRSGISELAGESMEIARILGKRIVTSKIS